MGRTNVVALLMCGLAFSAAAAAAQDATAVRESDVVAPAYGTATQSVTSIPAIAFLPIVSTGSTWFDAGNYYRRIGFGSGLFAAPVNLPTGVRPEKFELEACDTAGGAGAVLTARLVACGPTPINGCFIAAEISTPGPPDNACKIYSVDVNPAVTAVRNNQEVWIADISGGDGNQAFRGVRIYWRRQVSPAPGVASFSDVPTNHPLFQFVEALKASGITGGCTASTFCPDAPLTRGQMAVFLSAALGLHWPN